MILNEFCLNTGYHRKYAIRLLNGPPPGKQPVGRARRRALRYGQETLSILTAVWEAAGYQWSVRLKGAVADLDAVDAKAVSAERSDGAATSVHQSRYILKWLDAAGVDRGVAAK